MALRVDTPRTAMPSRDRNVSRETVSFIGRLPGVVLVGAVETVDMALRCGIGVGLAVQEGVDCVRPGGRHLGGSRRRRRLSTALRTEGSLRIEELTELTACRTVV